MPTQLIIPLDVDTIDQATTIVEQVGDACTWYKVGKQLFTANGPDTVRTLKRLGKNVFLDLKFHDIPNTVQQAVRTAFDLGADMVNVHASGGRAMMEAAAQARPDHGILIAVTVLTSLDQPALAEVGYTTPIPEQVARLARLAKDSGLNGVVASGQESAIIGGACGADFVQVIPGIRPATASVDDQKRTMTPAQAAQAGAHYIVVGRPITRAENPAAAARAIVDELTSVG